MALIRFTKGVNVKNPQFDYCPCCGHRKRFEAQKRQYVAICNRDSDERQMVDEHGISLATLPRPQWKSVNNPSREDRFILGLQIKNGSKVTPHELRQRHKRRHIRRQAAIKRKRMRQDGFLPYA